MKFDSLSRRMFLEGAGGALLAIPFLGSLLPRSARAQQAPIKRFISIITAYDMGHHVTWLPGAEAGPLTNIGQPARTFDPGNGHHAIRWQPLRDFAPTSSSYLTRVAGTALSPYLESMNVMRSVNFSLRYGHGAAQVLGGITGDRGLAPTRGQLATIETADVVLNKNRTFNPAGLPLIVCGNTGYGPDGYSYTTAGGAAANTTSVGATLLALYNRLFANGTLPENGTTTTRHPKYDLLGRVMGDYTRVRNSRNISTADRATLDNAVDRLRDTQAGLVRMSTAQCAHNSLARTGDVSQSASGAAVGAALANMIAAAIMCDSARVFTIGAPLLRGLLSGQGDDHDNISHRAFETFGGRPSWSISADRKTALVNNFVAPLLQRLAAATDPSNGRSYLYNSLVYFTAESGIAHGFGSHPVMLFGNAGGALSSGNYIDYADRSKGAFGGGDGFSSTVGDPTFSNCWWGVAYNRLLVTILRAMGLQPQDYENDALNAQVLNRTDLGPNNNVSSLGGFGYVAPQDILDPMITNTYALNNYVRPGLIGQDLRQFRNPLPLPT